MKINNNKGFTSLELMVLVCLLGILTAVAVPNFYRFRDKSRQVEAKIYLSALYMAEVTYHSQHKKYIKCLRQIGFVPESGTRYYAVGFNSSPGSGNAYLYEDLHRCNSRALTPGMALTDSDVVYSANSAPGGKLPTIDEIKEADIPDSQKSFKAMAVANLRGDGFDKWSIDELKNMREE